MLWSTNCISVHAGSRSSKFEDRCREPPRVFQRFGRVPQPDSACLTRAAATHNCSPIRRSRVFEGLSTGQRPARLGDDIGTFSSSVNSPSRSWVRLRVSWRGHRRAGSSLRRWCPLSTSYSPPRSGHRWLLDNSRGEGSCGGFPTHGSDTVAHHPRHAEANANGDRPP